MPRGALPQSIPYGEVYTSLQSGVVDGAEPELRDFYDAKWFEVQKFLSLSNYVWTANYWYANKAKLDSLSEADRKAVLDAAATTQTFFRKGIVEVYGTIIDKLKAAGLVVNEVDVDSTDPAVRAELERALYHGLDAFKLREVSPAWEEVAG